MKKVAISRRAFVWGLGALPVLAATPGIGEFVAPAAEAASGTAVQAIRQALAGDFSSANSLAKRSGSEAAEKLVELLYLKDKEEKAGYHRIAAFLKRAPKWPLSETMAKNAEKALFEERPDADTVLGYFANRKPATAHGNLALARAHVASGNRGAARPYLIAAWHDADLGAALEKRVMTEFGSQLSERDHKNRMWSLVLAQEPNAAIRNAKRLGSAYVQAAEAAQHLLREVSGAEKKYNALPRSLREAPAMEFALARYYRKREKFGKARDILAQITSDADAMINPEAFWTERRIIARRSLGPRQKEHYKTAYQIARNHGVTEGTVAIEGEFLAGWIALRHNNDAATALRHFTKLATLAPNRTEKSRAAYWIGRAHLAMRDMAKAREAFSDAAKYPTLYYGQLAREHVGLGKVAADVKSGSPSKDALERVARDEVVQAFRLMSQAGSDHHLHLFLWSLASRFTSVDEMNAVASVVSEVGDTTMALRFAKAAGQKGVDIDAWSYPIRAIPDFKQLGRPVERALVFGLSRQESEFNPKAGSTAGAKGLMQLLPGTARGVARRHGVTFAASRLLEPSYNAKLGAAHLAELVADYRGSYVLTLVAYNAGPRRVSEWIAAFGDPRSANVDAIDWVESIPFQETRQYVQKVLQNVQIYRSRLAPDTMKPLSADLRRGAAAGTTVASIDSADDKSCGGTTIADVITRCD